LQIVQILSARLVDRFARECVSPALPAWTKKRAPIFIVDRRRVCIVVQRSLGRRQTNKSRVYSSNVHLEEDKQQVKGMMTKYGMEKVRGGAYTQVSLSFSRIET
jgi:intein-encoded DNA endonuclease-like protein